MARSLLGVKVVKNLKRVKKKTAGLNAKELLKKLKEFNQFYKNNLLPTLFFNFPISYRSFKFARKLAYKRILMSKIDICM